MNFTELCKKEKYNYLSNVLDKIKNCKLYKEQKIEGNTELEKIRYNDIVELNKVISNELKKDNILKINIKNNWFYQ